LKVLASANIGASKIKDVLGPKVSAHHRKANFMKL